VKVIVKARHMEVTDSMRQYVESKAEKLPRYYDGVQSAEATLDMDADQAVAEIVVTARRKSTFVASHRGQDLYACVDECLRKITEQLRRHKDKVRDRQAPPLSQSTDSEPE
jgi:putative sigma-54 modulation protein